MSARRVLALAVLALLSGCGSSTNPAPGSGDAAAVDAAEARALAQEAYVVAYAPVANYAKQSPRAFDKTSLFYTGTNRFFSFPLLFNALVAQQVGVPSPNNDTLYSSAVLDLRAQPMVLSAAAVPDPKRYYSLQQLDLNTDVLPYISTLTNQNRGGDYLVLGPDNAEPADTSRFAGVIRSPSRIVTVLGRVQAYDDLDQVNAALVQSGFRITPLSEFMGTAAPAAAAELPPYNVAEAQGLGFFRYANLVFSLQPPEATDPALAARLARIHVGATQAFDAADFSPEVQDALLQGLADGAAAVQAAGLSHSIQRNGWSSVDPAVMTDQGSFGTDYLARAAVAYTLLYMNTRAEAWYGLAEVDGSGAPLTGANRYTLHFDAGQLPPSKFFWSVTAYDAATRLFIGNLINRYKVGSTTPGLQYSGDGSLDIFVQQTVPTDPTALANWLPVGSTPFYLIIRSYGPDQGILDGSWLPPPIQRAP